jgi:hypothetical protein
VRQWIYRLASDRDLIGLAFAEVCELKGIVNVQRAARAGSIGKGAFEKMLASGTAAHHAEHVLGALLFETEWETARAVEAGKDTEKLRGVYIRKLQKLIRDSAFRKKLTRQFTADHSAFE